MEIAASGAYTFTVDYAGGVGDSSGAVTAWAWDFGDGGASALPSTLHTYTQPGTYTVSLLVSGPGGSDWLERAGYIAVLPGEIRLFLPLLVR